MAKTPPTAAKTVRFPNELWSDLDQSVELAGAKNRNQLIVDAVREYLEKLVATQQDQIKA